MNVLTASGNLGKDAVLKATPSGTQLLSFSVGASSGFSERKKTLWLNCTIFGKRAATLEPMLLKGKKVVVSGELSLDEWTNADGVSHTSAKLTVNEVTLMSSPTDGPKQSATPVPPPLPEDSFGDMDIPF